MRYLAALILFLSVTACARHERVPMSNSNIALAVEQSHTLVKAGESVTFTAHASGVAGREESIKWESSGGDIKLLNKSERYARVEYDTPGIYKVTASLFVDGQLVRKQEALVQVDPLT